ncbi:MAG: MarR family winged helix-turn-helix transcriptional regulator [Ruthenibacterium sp.]
MSEPTGKWNKKGTSVFYRFISLYQDYMNFRRDYGDGTLHSMVEMHILSIICENPGITIGNLAKEWGCTKGAASQNVTKLEKKKLLIRTKLLDNAKEVHVYSTKQGQRLAELHAEYDKQNEGSTGQRLQERCTMEELIAFNKCMEVYSDILENDLGLLQEEKKV